MSERNTEPRPLNLSTIANRRTFLSVAGATATAAALRLALPSSEAAAQTATPAPCDVTAGIRAKTPNGEPLPGAVVTMKVDGKEVATGSTDSDGRYGKRIVGPCNSPAEKGIDMDVSTSAQGRDLRGTLHFPDRVTTNYDAKIPGTKLAPTSTATPTSTEIPTKTPTPTAAATFTSIPTATATSTPTFAPKPSETPTQTPSPVPGKGPNSGSGGNEIYLPIKESAILFGAAALLILAGTKGREKVAVWREKQKEINEAEKEVKKAKKEVDRKPLAKRALKLRDTAEDKQEKADLAIAGNADAEQTLALADAYIQAQERARIAKEAADSSAEGQRLQNLRTDKIAADTRALTDPSAPRRTSAAAEALRLQTAISALEPIFKTTVPEGIEAERLRVEAEAVRVSATAKRTVTEATADGLAALQKVSEAKTAKENADRALAASPEAREYLYKA